MKKNYKKLAFNIIEYVESHDIDDFSDILKVMINTAFGYSTEMIHDIERVYPKRKTSQVIIENQIDRWLNYEILKIKGIEGELYVNDGDENEDKIDSYYNVKKEKVLDYKNNTIANIIQSTTIPREHKIIALLNSLDEHFSRVRR